MKVVRPAWLVESAKTGVLLPWQDYIFKVNDRLEQTQGKRVAQRTLFDAYAPDPNAAERGTPSPHPLENLEVPASDTPDVPEPAREKSTTQDIPNTTDAEDPKNPKQMKNPFAQFVAQEAPIWALYLDEAEEEDKELIEPWKGSLDSLLIFVR